MFDSKNSIIIWNYSIEQQNLYQALKPKNSLNISHCSMTLDVKGTSYMEPVLSAKPSSQPFTLINSFISNNYSMKKAPLVSPFHRYGNWEQVIYNLPKIKQ